MRKTCLILALVWVVAILQAKVYIDSGGKCYLHEDVILHTNGNLIQNGEIVPDGGAFRFWGSDDTSIIGSSAIEIDGLELYKTSGAYLQLRSPVHVNQWLRLGKRKPPIVRHPQRETTGQQTSGTTSP